MCSAFNFKEVPGIRAASRSRSNAPVPQVGYRQWVLSFGGPLAVRLGYDQVLVAAVAERFARAVMQNNSLDAMMRQTISVEVWKRPKWNRFHFGLAPVPF